MNRVNPTIIMFLELAAWVYRNVDKPSAIISAQVKHRTEAAKARGIEARRAPILPTAKKLSFRKSALNKHIMRYNCNIEVSHRTKEGEDD
jgi:hypothetical protein